jgi:DNA-binding transcriptional ArsR family regulator
MDAKTRLLYWLLYASRGGPTRLKILKVLFKKPMNMRQLALSLELDYKTVQGHVTLLIENSILDTPRKKYGSLYFINPELEDNDYLKELLGGNGNEKRK